MCGIVGFLNAQNADASEAVLRPMMDRIAHRGPDSAGAWTSGPVALGHLRLAIVDLSPAGHQPMQSGSGRYTLVFNGEIYNHQEIRRELDAAGRASNWRGGSDTETLLAGIDAWGLEPTLHRTVGMFAFALWDATSRQLTLVRDRFGEKPLYYGRQGQSFLFGSELKALAAHPTFAAALARDSLVEILRHGHVGGDRSIYAHIHKVLPGEMVTVSACDLHPQRTRYYDAMARAATTPKRAWTEPEAVSALDQTLTRAVGLQMVSDVPLGAFLSGGIDSSTVVSLMQAQSTRPVNTFSIGFNEARYNEAEHARAVAAHLGTHHTDLYVSDTELRDVIPLLPAMYDEPFADSSQIPTHLVSRLARAHVTVSLSGDGGDELFCGYGRYEHAQKLRARLARVPWLARRAMAGAVRGIPASALTTALERFVPTPEGKEPIGQRLHRLANYAAQRDLDALHRATVSVWRFPHAAVLGASEAPGDWRQKLPDRAGLGDLERMMQLDVGAYLVDDILTKVDRASMAVALESRAPLLDHRVAELAWSMPEHLKLRAGGGKWVLRQVLQRYVPAALIDRPNMGFEVPVGIWLRTSLRDWAGDLLSRESIRRTGAFDPDAVTRLWQQHQSHQFNWGAQIWNLLAVQAWISARPHP